MNDFCEYCTGAGNNTNSDKTEIRKCKDRNCPFYRDRWSNMEWQNEKLFKKRSKNNEKQTL